MDKIQANMHARLRHRYTNTACVIVRIMQVCIDRNNAALGLASNVILPSVGTVAQDRHRALDRFNAASFHGFFPTQT